MQGLGVNRLPQQFGIALVAQDPRDAGKRLQVIRACTFGSKQQEHQIDRLIINCLEVDRFDQPGENTNQTIERDELAMRDSDAMTDSGRTKAFALQQGIEYFPSRQTGYLSRMRRDFLDRLLFRIGLERGKN